MNSLNPTPNYNVPVTPAEPETGHSGENPAWNLADVLLVTGFAFVALILSVIVVFAAAYARMRHVSVTELADNVLLAIYAQAMAYGLVVGAMALVVWQKSRKAFFEGIRWNTPRLPAAVMAVGGGAALGLGLQILSGQFEKYIPKSLPIERLFHDASSAYALAIFGTFVAPIVEELYFRGFLYPVLARLIGVTGSVIVTAAAFAGLHAVQLAGAWIPMLVIFVVGLVLTIVRARTKSVATTVLLHMGYNAALFITLFIVTQGFHHMERA